MKSEKEIQAECLEWLGAQKFCRVWRSNTGSVKIGNRFVKFGLKGQADLSGILLNGTRLEIEIKSEKGGQSEEQKNFENMIKKYNGIYLLVRSLDDLKEKIKNVLSP